MFYRLKLTAVLMASSICMFLSGYTPVHAVSFYVDPEGNDVSAGTTPESPWKTLTKVSQTNFLPGDTILLKRGSIFRDQLTVSSSGTAIAPITYTVYGTGNNPLIKRTDIYSNWTLYYDSNGIKIWTGALSQTKARGVTENGDRRTSIYIPSGTLPHTILKNETFGPAPSGYAFYYRKDSGPPVNTEIGSRQFGILIDTKDYIIIDGIDAEGPGASLSSLAENAPIYIDPNNDQHPELKSHHITLKNLTVSLSNGIGIGNGASVNTPVWTVYGPENVVYDRIAATNNQSTGIYHLGTGTISNSVSHHNGLLPFDTGDRGGIGIQGGPLRLERNEVYAIGSETENVDFAISIFEPTGRITLFANYIHDVNSGGIQIHSDSGNAADDHLLAYNIISRYGTSTFIGATSGKTAAVRIHRTDNVAIYNNLFAYGGSNSTTKSIFARYHARHLNLKNNLFYQNANSDISIYPDTDATGFASDSNLYYKSSYDRNWEFLSSVYHALSAWQIATSHDLHSITNDPQFVFPLPTGVLDYQLQSTSPAIDSGTEVGLSSDYLGSAVPGGLAPDIGSFEFTQNPPPDFRDINQDGYVDSLDLFNLIPHFNQTGLGDFNHNTIVDLFDFSFLISGFIP